MLDPIIFSANPLDRATRGGRDEGWYEAARADPAARAAIFWRGKPLIAPGDAPRLVWRPLLEGHDPWVYLGTTVDGAPRLAVDVSTLDKAGAATLAGDDKFIDARAIAPQLAGGEAGIVAQGRSMLDWHARHGFCACCGAATRPALGGRQRLCVSPDCGAEHFPRTDPVAIMLAVRGEHCLVGRQAGFPLAMYSALAGFVEPGETLEEAVRREVREETGVGIGAVRYVKSQPWPFPSSLMLACLAEATSEALDIDHAELADARWVSRAQVRAALVGAPDASLMLPPPLAVAHHLLYLWAGDEKEG